MPLPAWLRRLMGGLRRRRHHAADALPEDILAPQEPRAHHYRFAHYALREIARANPAGYLGMVSTEEGLAALVRLWEQVGETLPPDDRLPPRGLAAELRSAGEYEIALVTLPSPVNVTEAFFTAFAVGPLTHLREFVTADAPNTSDFVEAFKQLPAFYYTLEVGFNLPGRAPRTVFGEWTADGSHANYGDGPPPTRDAFFERICRMLASRSTPS